MPGEIAFPKTFQTLSTICRISFVIRESAWYRGSTAVLRACLIAATLVKCMPYF